MSDSVEIWDKPLSNEIYMIAGWRQWADAGSVSSGLPQYLIQHMGAKQIGKILSDDFYLFQFPGTHDLLRPAVRFEHGYPISLQIPRNEIFYTGDQKQGLIIFLGDEPHLNIERYSEVFLTTAKSLGVKRILCFGGVYGELPFDKERLISGIYSLPTLKKEMDVLSVKLSDYQGGASIGTYLCKRAGEMDTELVAFYAFAPTYDFSNIERIGNTIRIENDFMAWLGVLRRVNYMVNAGIDLTDLEKKSEHLIRLLEEKIENLASSAPELGVREYFKRLSDEFIELPFNPLDEIWEDELRRLLGDFDSGESPQNPI